jgi:exodeoxyribonuclease VII large subunit
MHYKLEHFEMQIPALIKSFDQNIHFILQQKMQELEHLKKKTEMSDPKLQCKKGWAQISVKGEAIALDSLHENDIFTLEDASTKIEAVCVAKETYLKTD